MHAMQMCSNGGRWMWGLTCAEVDDEVEKKDSVWDAVENDPVCAQVIVEEGDYDWQDYEIGN